MNSWRRWTLVGVLLLLAAATATLAWQRLRTPDAGKVADRYLVQAVDRGDVQRSVSASGSISPVNLIQVGTSVSGTIRRLHVDFNTQVQAGQLLAEIDPATLDADLAQTRALQRSAAASVELARIRLQRVQGLYDQGFITRAELDDARAALKTAEASVDQQSAAVQRASTNRRNADIRSPVQGVVVAREVSIGQTVAASLQTPVLFRIAQDLRDIQIETNVSEADVGLLQEGQAVTFTVDAFPDRSFSGRLQQIRNNHSVLQNVVTYTAVIRARNDDMALRPGMTGYVNVVVADRRDVLRIPNAALRYEPAGTPAAQGSVAQRNRVWRLGPDGNLQPVELKLGISDGRFTEVLAGPLAASDALAIGDRTAGASFGPRIF